MKTALLLFAILLLAVVISCKHVVQYDCTGVTPTYTENIKPILDATCSGSECHTHGQAEAGYDLSSYAGAAQASKKKGFMKAIQHMPFSHNMPKDADRLPDTQIHMIYCWIENGAPE